jgi:hypothetical protein
MTIDYAERARALVGIRFRPQGRGADGMDCVGLILSAYAISSAAARRNYRLAGDHRAELELGLAQSFRRVSSRSLKPGDVMLLALARERFHLVVRTAAGFVHAHAGIGRVVETPGLPDWPLIGVYRKRTRTRSN